MTNKLVMTLLAGWLAFTLPALGQAGNTSPEEMIKLAKALKYQQGAVDLRGGLAKVTLPPEFRLLGPDDAETVLVKLWGNPPSGQKPLGMLIPTGMTPFTSNCWVVTISYDEDGYVKDDDASKINYDDLLKTMQKGVEENNKKRREQGYPAITLLGWATPPRYDAANHKMYWAKRVKFEGEEAETLNYNIRMLGRKGVLELNAIAQVDQLDEVQRQTPAILGMVDFKEGSRYADFDPKVDKVAEYGLAALVVGGIAAKAGLFKLLLVGLTAGWKFVVIGLAAFVGFFKKLFKGKRDTTGS